MNVPNGPRSDRRHAHPARKRGAQAGFGLVSIASLSLLFAGGAAAANPPVNLASTGFFSVLAGTTVTNTGPTTMFADLGLDPGSSVTGAPHVLGAAHIDDAVALNAKNDLVNAFTDAAGRPATALASADLSGQTFTPGVYAASSQLLFSAGEVTLNAQGNPDAVFIFQVGSSLTTGSATTVQLTNGAQPCNVFWQVGASVTLGTNSRFDGTVMALTTITAQTGATLDGRLLARNGAVNLDTNTITTSACAAGTTGRRPREPRGPPDPGTGPRDHGNAGNHRNPGDHGHAGHDHRNRQAAGPRTEHPRTPPRRRRHRHAPRHHPPTLHRPPARPATPKHPHGSFTG